MTGLKGSDIVAEAELSSEPAGKDFVKTNICIRFLTLLLLKDQAPAYSKLIHFYDVDKSKELFKQAHTTAQQIKWNQFPLMSQAHRAL